jgi:hypothetical protein
MVVVILRVMSPMPREKGMMMTKGSKRLHSCAEDIIKVSIMTAAMICGCAFLVVMMVVGSIRACWSTVMTTLWSASVLARWV